MSKVLPLVVIWKAVAARPFLSNNHANSVRIHALDKGNQPTSC